MSKPNKKKKLLKFSGCIILIIVLVLGIIRNPSEVAKNKYIYDYERYFATVLIAGEEENGSISESEIENAKDESYLNIFAHSAISLDFRDGHILYGKNYSQQMPMASTTKILTAIIALETSEPDEIITVSKNAADSPKVHLGIKEGEQYYMKDLLLSMMLGSHNDSAVAIAEHIGGNTENFAVIMNKKAIEIGLENSNFVTPNGLDADEHFSTAYDMAKLGAYAMENSEFVTLVNTPSHSFSEFNGKSYHSVSNINSYLTMDDTAIGIKTGFTCNAGYCFVGANEFGNTVVVSTVLASGWPPNKTYKWQDMKKIIAYVNENYTEFTLKVPEKKMIINYNGTGKNVIFQGYDYQMLHREGEEITRIIRVTEEYGAEEFLVYANVVKQIEN